MISSETISTNFCSYFRARNYEIEPNHSLLIADPTLLFVNSTVTIFKNILSRSEEIPPTAHVQDCFRMNSDLNSFMFFKMIGIEGGIEHLARSINDMYYFLISECNMKSDNIFAVIQKEDYHFITCWNKSVSSENIVLIDSPTKKYSTRWKYGDLYPLQGYGMTVVYENPETPHCSADCNIHCDCVKYTRIGNFIVIRNTNTGREYVDAGFGLERIAAHQCKGDLYLLPEIMKMVEALTLLGYERSEAKQLITLIRSIERIVLEGIVPGNKKREYILRSLIRKFALILLNNEVEKVYTDAILCNLKEMFSALSFCFSDFSCRDILVNEVRMYLETIRKALVSAKAYILHEKLVGSVDSIRKIKATFGLPEFLIWSIINNPNG